jgi:tetratricopeptide (TPR) repeat protein
MLKTLIKNHRLAVNLFLILALNIIPKISHAQSSISNAQAIDQIQKTLLFSDENLAKKASKERRSVVNIDRSGSKIDQPAKVKILAVDPNTNYKIAQKEKLAYSAVISGQYEAAVEVYKQILETDPNNSYAKFALATCYHKLGQYSQAKAIYYKLLKNGKKDVLKTQDRDEIIGNLIEVIVEESPNDAVYLLSKLSNQNPNSARILANSAMAYNKINKNDQAILLLKRAINIDPNEDKYKLNLAIIYDKMADYQNALNFYQNVINSYVGSQAIDSSIPIVQIKQRVEFIKTKL